MTAAEALRSPLLQGAERLGCPLTDDQAGRLLAFAELLLRWNRVHNLTAIREAQGLLTHHLLDCLAVVSPLRGWLAPRGRTAPRLLDVGSGAGLPAVVLAVMLQEAQVVSVDAVAKKTAFVRQAALELGLAHLVALHGRVESVPPQRADVITSRAFASLAEVVRLTRVHLQAGGVWLAMKGRRPDDEMAALPGDIDVFHVEQLDVPGLGAERCLVWMRIR